MAEREEGQKSGTRRVTLVDVARHAHVSCATASLVLRGSPLVAEETRQRLLASMRSLGYIPHRAAASLRTQRSHMIGLVVTDITNPFYAELTVGIEEQLDAANYVVMLTNTAESLVKQERLLVAMRENNADGLLFCPAEGTPQATIQDLQSAQLPVVLLVRYLTGLEGDYVGVDNVMGARLAVEHMIGLGHRRIAFIGGPPTSSARADRLRGYREVMAAHDLVLDEGLCPSSPATREGGYAAIRNVLSHNASPTAALCYNDVVAFGVMLGLQAVGYVVGHDFSVVGFDDIAEAALWHPALTTIAAEPRRIGMEAAQLLLERIADPTAPPRRIILPPALVIRATCGAANVQDRQSLLKDMEQGSFIAHKPTITDAR